MTECDEIAVTLGDHAPRLSSFDAALAYVARQMPGEDPAGTIVNNVAWSLWRRQSPRTCPWPIWAWAAHPGSCLCFAPLSRFPYDAR